MNDQSMMRFIITVLFLCGQSAPTYGQSDQRLVVVPSHQATNPGKTITLTCNHNPEDASADEALEWFASGSDTALSKKLPGNETKPDILPISVSQSSTDNVTASVNRFSVENNTLTITNISLEDAGVYTCKNKDGSLKVESTVKVFVMPTYFTEGMIVVGINCGLVVVFFVCFIWQQVNEKRQKTKTKRMVKLGRKEVAKRMLSE